MDGTNVSILFSLTYFRWRSLFIHTFELFHEIFPMLAVFSMYVYSSLRCSGEDFSFRNTYSVFCQKFARDSSLSYILVSKLFLRLHFFSSLFRTCVKTLRNSRFTPVLMFGIDEPETWSILHVGTVRCTDQRCITVCIMGWIKLVRFPEKRTSCYPFPNSFDIDPRTFEINVKCRYKCKL